MNTNQRLHLIYSLHVFILSETLGDRNCIIMCMLQIRTFKIGGWGGNSGKGLPQKSEDTCVCEDMGFLCLEKEKWESLALAAPTTSTEFQDLVRD